MMRILAMGSLAALAVVSASAMWMTSATAQQTAQTPCGPASYSSADQRQVMPCAPPTTKAENGQPGCGVSSYSVAEQRQTVLPCTPPTPKAEQASGKAPCGPASYSVAEQRQVIPCTQ